jgi:hypothetical protein
MYYAAVFILILTEIYNALHCADQSEYVFQFPPLSCSVSSTSININLEFFLRHFE